MIALLAIDYLKSISSSFLVHNEFSAIGTSELEPGATKPNLGLGIQKNSTKPVPKCKISEKREMRTQVHNLLTFDEVPSANACVPTDHEPNPNTPHRTFH